MRSFHSFFLRDEICTSSFASAHHIDSHHQTSSSMAVLDRADFDVISISRILYSLFVSCTVIHHFATVCISRSILTSCHDHIVLVYLLVTASIRSSSSLRSNGLVR